MKTLILCLIGLSMIIPALAIYSLDKTVKTREEVYQMMQLSEKERKFLKRNLRSDNNKCLMNPHILYDHTLMEKYLPKNKRGIVSGRIKYARIYKGPYKYKYYINKEGKLFLGLKIHLRPDEDVTNFQLGLFKSYVKTAAKRFAEENPTFIDIDLDVKFVDKKEDAYQSIRVISQPTRGPYNKKWYLRWSLRSMTHELGHMLGLNDEYNYTLGGGNTSKCIKNSIMCAGNDFFDFQYYQIIRRVVCDS